MFVYKVSQINGELTYAEIKKMKYCTTIKEKIHLGQLKLLITEMLFLTKVAKKNDLVVYAGAAEGHHIQQLADFFPDCNFELWDPRPFAVKETHNIKLFNDFFTESVAKSYADRPETKEGRLLFLSDIRDRSIEKFQKEESLENQDDIDELIVSDNDKQLRWVRIMRPRYAYLKFRLPYGEGKTEYLGGKIYLQPYSPLGTETRIFTNEYDKLVTYDNQQNDRRLAYFNCYYRGNIEEAFKYDYWIDIFKKYNIRNSWDNNAAFYILNLYLDKYGKGKDGERNSPDNIAKLFNKIVKYLKDIFGHKYNVIYEKK